MSDKIRKHIIFHGRVQGVGFRWHATNFANSAGLTGWVQNLEDGTVEMEVQGRHDKNTSVYFYHVHLASQAAIHAVHGVPLTRSFYENEEKIDSLVDYLENRDYVLIEKMDCNSLPLENSEWEFRERGW